MASLWASVNPNGQNESIHPRQLDSSLPQLHDGDIPIDTQIPRGTAMSFLLGFSFPIYSEENERMSSLFPKMIIFMKTIEISGWNLEAK